MSTDETSLGATIHAWRDRLTPGDVGLPAGRARRYRNRLGWNRLGRDRLRFCGQRPRGD